MLKLLNSCRGEKGRFKCGEVYCEIPNNFNINCFACDVTFAINEFSRHFQELHLNLQNLNSEEQVDFSRIINFNDVDGTSDSKKSFEHFNNREEKHGMAIEFLEVRLPKLNSIKAKRFLPEHILDFGSNETLLNQNLLTISTIKNETSLFRKENAEMRDLQIQDLSQNVLSKVNSCKPNRKAKDYGAVEEMGEDPKTHILEERKGKLDEKYQLFMTENKDEFSSRATKKLGTECKTKCSRGNSQTQFICKYCQRSYKVKRSLRNHVRLIHERGQSLDSDKPDRQHKEISNNVAFICNICGKSFTTVGSMNTHKKRHSGVKSHKCPDCESSFHTDHEMKKHLLYRHSDLYAEICEICGRGFRISGNLKGHMRRHTGERPAKCVVCGKSFYSQYDLNVHNSTHMTERPFPCDACSSTFRTKKALRVHKKLHVPDRPHQCELCNKGFLQITGLESHMRQVHMKSAA